MPRKKIFDIIPPQISRKKPILPKLEPKIKKILRIKRGVMISVGVLIVGVILSYFLIPHQAEIDIWPETKVSHFETDVKIPKEIPKKIVKIEKKVSREFSASGSKLIKEKARGIIRVYNAYSTVAQPLVRTTRFVSAERKLFRTPKRVLIPGGHYDEKGELVPGHTDIEVVADQPGKEFNIGPTKFSIPGFAGTAKYTAFYAESFQPMKGGRIIEVKQVSKEDLQKAQEILKEKALAKSRIALESKISEDQIFLKDALRQQITEISPWAKPGQKIDKFLVQAKAEAKILTFKKEHLESFAKSFVLTQIPKSKDIVENSLKIDWNPLAIDLKKEEILLNLKIGIEIYSKIDLQNLKLKIKERDLPFAQQILKDYPQISKSKIRISPFWLRKIPIEPKQIDIKLKF